MTADLLLVEDDASDLELALRALKKCGLENRFQIVRDGAEALDFLWARSAYAERARSALPKAVFLDLKMSKLDGLATLRMIRSDPRTRHVPVVIFTSSDQDQDVLDSYTAGVNSYVVKAVDFREFSDRLGGIARYWADCNRAPP